MARCIIRKKPILSRQARGPSMHRQPYITSIASSYLQQDQLEVGSTNDDPIHNIAEF